MSAVNVLKTLCHPYHTFNILFSVSYLGCKLIEPLNHFVFPSQASASSELSSWETEVFFFLMVVVMFRTRRSGARTAVAYVSTATFYAKGCNMILWFSADPAKGMIYVFSMLVHFLLVGEPVYLGPEHVTYFQGLQAVEDALRTNDGTVWLLAFYAPWASTCAQLAPIFSKLSLEYSLDNFKFGKIDVGKFPEVSRKYKINDSPISNQIPTLALYKDGELLMRRPTIDANKKLQKFFFTEDNIRAGYDLNNVFRDCKKRLKENKSGKSKKNQ